MNILASRARGLAAQGRRTLHIFCSHSQSWFTAAHRRGDVDFDSAALSHRPDDAARCSRPPRSGCNERTVCRKSACRPCSLLQLLCTGFSRCTRCGAQLQTARCIRRLRRTDFYMQIDESVGFYSCELALPYLEHSTAAHTLHFNT